MKLKILLFSLAALLLCTFSFAQVYNKAAGINSVETIRKAKHIDATRKAKRSAPQADSAPLEEAEAEPYFLRETVETTSGSSIDDFDWEGYDIEKENKDVERQTGRNIDRQQYEVSNDGYGNASGSEYDLAVDGAFKGQTICVIQLYHETRFDFADPKAALEQKGFNVVRYVGDAPSPTDLKEALDMSCQLWVISDKDRHMNDEHLKVIKDFFDAGHGVYIWGDNQPYYADANFLAQGLIGGNMTGNLPGNTTVNLLEKGGKSGLVKGHLITTGLEYCFEGITIATLDKHEELTPILYGSAGNLVSAAYEQNGKRLMLEGGFTKLYINWQSAGTARYCKNAAAWLANYERFGDELTKSN
jgi:hypothetical protein